METEGPVRGSMDLDRLGEEITEQAAHIYAATCRWLMLVTDFDRREGWARWGCGTCAQWLSWRCGLSETTARDQVRVARKLAELPRTRETFGRGELSYSQIRAITRVATPDTEAELVMLAKHATAAQLDVIVSAYRGVLDTELGGDQEEHRQRYVTYSHDHDGSLLIRARLPAEEGAVVMAALQSGREALRADVTSGGHASASAPAETTQTRDAGARGTPTVEAAESRRVMSRSVV